MARLSNARKLGVVARVATQQAQRNRLVRAAGRGVSTTAKAFGGVLHTLWLEVTGVVFLLMALSLGAAAFKEYGKYHAGQVGIERVGLALFFTLIFTWFGISSFWRVKKKSSKQRI